MGKLIVFDGMSTTGKSTVSSIVFKKLNADGQCVWFHEEDREHPTRIDERDAWENSERFRLMWHDRWKRFLSEADANDISGLLKQRTSIYRRYAIEISITQ